jgi:hypothetical protein
MFTTMETFWCVAGRCSPAGDFLRYADAGVCLFFTTFGLPPDILGVRADCVFRRVVISLLLVARSVENSAVSSCCTRFLLGMLCVLYYSDDRGYYYRWCIMGACWFVMVVDVCYSVISLGDGVDDRGRPWRFSRILHLRLDLRRLPFAFPASVVGWVMPLPLDELLPPTCLAFCLYMAGDIVEMHAYSSL